MNHSSVTPITEDDIADFLVNTPGFFERHAELLSAVTISSPHGQRAVSLQERQAEMLREKIKGLEHRVMDMVRHGHENTAITHKIHQWSRELLAVQDVAELPQAVEQGIHRLFDVPQVALRLWGTAGMHADAPFTHGASEDVRSFASSLTMPFCGPNLGFEATAWLPQAGQAQSLALLPLRRGAIDSADEPAFGLLVLGSPDPHRFEATMGTDYLARIAELASAGLTRLL
ncbi:MAG: DUF484 family protein [Alicycliphilus sp.]|nr:DUF484 family protein [Alicycliphilus sp.]TXJ08085.1 MAG: DUF484 family protein [Alicycliphilus sp.]HRO53719.1 DUF484 family protein [Alicycliphilus sp.]HRP21685.1 DUF484 family protein [Alicycliphilus sp.]